jgi:hypothetical protein
LFFRFVTSDGWRHTMGKLGDRAMATYVKAW